MRPLIMIAVACLCAARLAAQAPIARDTFAAEVQRAAHADDRQAIAQMIRYPITVSMGGVRVPFADAAAFLARYDDIFTPELRDSIARGGNDVAIAEVDGRLRITAISVPRFADGTAAREPASAAPESKPSTVTRKLAPRRIAIRVGPRPTQIPGTLVRDTVDTFVLYLPKGKLASVRLERVPSGAASIRVVHARTGAPLSARTSADGRFVTGRPTEDGDYRIEVRRTDLSEGHLPYMLSLALR